MFKSDDSGQSWRSVSSAFSGRRVEAIAIDPTDSRNVLAGISGSVSGRSGILRSIDSGITWAEANTGLAHTYRAGISAIAFDPLKPSSVFCVADSTPYKSADGGATWTPVPVCPEFQCDLIKGGLLLSPSSAEAIFVGATDGIYRSTDEGSSWTLLKIPDQLGGNFLTGLLAVDPNNPAVIFVEGNSGILRSVDRGNTWALLPSQPNPADPSTTSLAIDPSSSSILYATNSGIWKSTDGGRTWATASNGMGLNGSLPTTILLLDPSDPQTLIAGGSTVYVSHDGASTWLPAGAGLSATSVRSIAIASSSQPAVYVSTGGSLFRSTDQGGHWNDSLAGFASGINGAANESPIAIDPQNSKKILLGIYEGLLVSDDGGATWQIVHLLPNDFNASPAVLAFHPTLAGRVFAGASRISDVHGVFYSDDGGGSWTYSFGIYGTVASIAACPSALFVGTAASPTSEPGLFKSMAGGLSYSWNPLTFPQAQADAISVDPRDQMHILVGTEVNQLTGPGAQSGLYESRDGGSTWTLTALAGSSVTAILFDSVEPGTVWLGTGGQGVFRMAEGTGSWLPVLDGLTDLTIQALAEESDGTILAGTFGTGVFAYRSLHLTAVPAPKPVGVSR